MNALVLAAGVGSRLSPYTDHCPKPMLEVGGQPIIAYNLAMLANSAFRDVVINLHYLPDSVREYVGDGTRWGLRISYSEEPILLGTAGALLPVRDVFTNDTFAVVFGDNINDIDLDEMLVHHRKSGAQATIAVTEREDVSQSGVVELGEADRIVRFIEKPSVGETSSHWINAGIALLEPSVLKFLTPTRGLDLGRDVLPGLAQSPGGLYGFRMLGDHWWFDRTEDFRAARDDDALFVLANRVNAQVIGDDQSDKR